MSVVISIEGEGENSAITITNLNARRNVPQRALYKIPQISDFQPFNLFSNRVCFR